MKERLKTIWHHHRYMLIGFVAAVLLTLFFTIKTVGGLVYWSQHRDATLEPWMTIGYIAHSYQLPPKVIGDALGLSQSEERHKPIDQIARDAGMEYDRFKSEVLTIIDEARRVDD